MPAGQTLSDRLVAICPCFLLYHSWRHYDRFQLFCCRLQPFFCSIGSCTSSPLGASTALLPLEALCPFSWLHLLPDRHTLIAVLLPIIQLYPFGHSALFCPLGSGNLFCPLGSRNLVCSAMLPLATQSLWVSLCACICACMRRCVWYLPSSGGLPELLLISGLELRNFSATKVVIALSDSAERVVAVSWGTWAPVSTTSGGSGLIPGALPPGNLPLFVAIGRLWKIGFLSARQPIGRSVLRLIHLDCDPRIWLDFLVLSSRLFPRGMDCACVVPPTAPPFPCTYNNLGCRSINYVQLIFVELHLYCACK